MLRSFLRSAGWLTCWRTCGVSPRWACESGTRGGAPRHQLLGGSSGRFRTGSPLATPRITSGLSGLRQPDSPPLAFGPACPPTIPTIDDKPGAIQQVQRSNMVPTLLRSKSLNSRLLRRLLHDGFRSRSLQRKQLPHKKVFVVHS